MQSKYKRCHITKRDIKLIGYIAVKSQRIPRNAHIQAKHTFISFGVILNAMMKRPSEGEHSEQSYVPFPIEHDSIN